MQNLRFPDQYDLSGYWAANILVYFSQCVCYKVFNHPKNSWALIQPFDEHLKYSSLNNPHNGKYTNYSLVFHFGKQRAAWFYPTLQHSCWEHQTGKRRPAVFPENIWLKGSVLDALSHNLNTECLKLLSTATSVGQK